MHRTLYPEAIGSSFVLACPRVRIVSTPRSRQLPSATVPRIDFETTIRAPIHRVFDLCRSVDAHITSATATGGRPAAVGGVAGAVVGTVVGAVVVDVEVAIVDGAVEVDVATAMVVVTVVEVVAEVGAGADASSLHAPSTSALHATSEHAARRAAGVDLPISSARPARRG